MPSFTTRLVRPEGTGTWTYARTTKALSAKLPRGQVRIKGTVDGHPVRSTLLPQGDGTHILVVKADVRKAIGKESGAKVEVEFEVDTAAPDVDVPAELAAALRKGKAHAAFDRLAPSHRKEYATHVAEAKRPETRQRRAEKAVAAILAGRKEGP